MQLFEDVKNTKKILWNTILKLKENETLKNKVKTLQDQLENKFDISHTIIGQSS